MVEDEEKQNTEGSKEDKKEEKKEEKKEDKKEPNLVEQAKVENDRKEALLKEEKELQDRKEKLHAEQMVGGKAGMSSPPPKPKDLTDEEYAEAVDRGEADPLKDDGIKP